MPVEVQVKVVGDTPDEARSQLRDLLSQPLANLDVQAGAAVPVSSPDDEMATKKIDMVFSRVGPNIRTLITAAATFDDGYQTADLAKKMNVPPVKLRSYAANLGRTMKRVNATLGDDTPIYKWDEQHGKWVMPEPIRRAVLAKTA